MLSTLVISKGKEAMRRRTVFTNPWLRAALVVGCIQSPATFAEDRFIHQPKPTTAATPTPPQSQLNPHELPYLTTPAKTASESSFGLNPSVPRSVQRSQDSQANNEPAETLKFAAPAVRNLMPPPVHSGSTIPETAPKAATSTPHRSINQPGGAITRNPIPAHSLQWVAKSADARPANVQMPPAQRLNSHGLAAVPHQADGQPLNQPHLQQVNDLSQQRFIEMETRMLGLESKLTDSLAADREQESKPTVAMLVSSTILNDPKFHAGNAAQLEISSVETPHGWQAIGQQLSARMLQCEQLLGRGAYLSAREEAEAGVLMLLRHLDLISNTYRCEPTWVAANQALRESEDFVVTQRSTSDSGMLKRLIESHETPLLKGASLDGVSPIIAAQHYRLFAEKLLTDASQSHPWASELYYAIGRAYQAEADQNTDQVDSLRAHALCYYRAARATLPTNAVACNQLGYLLLQMDRPADAREAIAAALTQKSDDAFLSNLAEASRRLGDVATQNWANQTLANRWAGRPPQPNTPQIVELSPAQFAELSPYAGSPQQTTPTPAPELPSSTNMNRTATATASSGLR